VNPAGVNVVPPRDTGVVPIVIVLLDNEAFPILLIVLTEPLIVLLVKVSVVSLPTNVVVAVGSVIVPEFVIVDITGAVSVLFVNVSVVSLPTNVVVAVGNVTVPVFDIDDITGVVNVLFVRVCDPVSVATVPSIAIVTGTDPL
jgi:hypothetical protein